MPARSSQGLGWTRFLAGAKYRSIRKTRPHLILQSSENMSGLKNGDAIEGAAFAENLQPYSGASTLARYPDGQPAILENSFGRGKAILIGSFVGLAYQEKQDPLTGEFLRALASAAGVAPNVQVIGAGTSQVEVRRLISENEQFVFVFNHADSAADTTIRLRLPWRVQNARDLISGESLTAPALQAAANGDDTILQKKIAAKGIWIVRLDRQ